MATQLQLRRGTTSENGSFTGALGEVTVDTDKDTLVVHDGATAGGHEVAKADGSNIEKLTKSGATKITTTSGGCDITGSLSADGAILSGNLELSYAYPRIKLTDTDHNSDYSIINNNGAFGIFDDTNNAYRLNVAASGDVSIPSGSISSTGSLGTWSANMDNAQISMTRGGTNYITAGTASGNFVLQTTTSGNSTATALALDANQNVSIPNGSLTVDGAITATTADNNPQITLISTDADANSGPVAKLYRNSASPADNDVLGKVQFSGKDDAGNENTYALIQTTATDVSNGSENAKMDFYVAVNDSFAPSLTLENNNVSIPNGTLTTAGGAIFGGNITASTIYRTGGNGSGLHFSTNATLPVNETSNVSDGTETLGSTAYRFKDAHLSGTVTVPTMNGSTGASGVATIKSCSGNNNHSKITVGNIVSSDNGGISFYTAGSSAATEAMRISGTTQNVSIPNGDLTVASGNGVFLGGTAAANKLDDYEEGTFTPSYTVAGGGSVTGVTSTNIGTYTKVGRMCTVSITSNYVQTSGTAPTSYIVTLPFTAGSTGGQQGGGFGQETGQQGIGVLIGVGNSASTAVIKKYDGGSPPANSYFSLSFTYQTA